MNLIEWLTAHGFENYADVFVANEISLDVLPHLSDDDLKELGMSMGARRRFLAAANTMGNQHPEFHSGTTLVEEQLVPEQPVNENPATLSNGKPDPSQVRPASIKPPQIRSGYVDESEAFYAESQVNSQFYAPPVIDASAAAKPGKSPKSKATAILVTIAVHIALAILAALFVILPAAKDEPEIVAMVAPVTKVKQEMQKRSVQKQVKRSPSSSSSASAPMAMMMKANAVAKFTVPDVKITSTGPLGMGEGDFGSGGFGAGTGLGRGGGGAETMFGSAGGGGLIGVFYDLKQTPDRKPTGFNTGADGPFYGVLDKFERDRFSPQSARRYYQAKQKVSFTNLLIPTMNANEGPKAFNVQKEVQPKGWFVHYSGRVRTPQDGQWRFVGRMDDGLRVFVNGKMVLDGCWSIKSRGLSEPFSKKAFANGQPAVAGKWVNLSGGFQLDILIGERPGGHFGGGIMIQRKDENYKKRGDGSPIIPLFSTVPLSSGVKKRMKAFPYEIEERTPIFIVL